MSSSFAGPLLLYVHTQIRLWLPISMGQFWEASDTGKTVGLQTSNWSGPLVIFHRFSATPWLGILIPESLFNAVVRRAFIREIEITELLQILSLAEQRFGPLSSYSDAKSCKVQLASLGLM